MCFNDHASSELFEQCTKLCEALVVLSAEVSQRSFEHCDNVMAPGYCQDVFKCLTRCYSIHEDSGILWKEFVDKCLETSVIVSLTKPKKSSSGDNILHRGL